MTSDLIASIVQRALDCGHPVEIEGLGTFRRKGSGFAFDPESSAHVFIAYAVEDLPQVMRLTEALRGCGYIPWLDKERLRPGQNWPRAIERAIEVADAFVPCFSTRSAWKRGQFQSELRFALDCARRRPMEEDFIVPVRLEECDVPRRVRDQLQYVDLFPDWDTGFERLATAIRKAAQKRPLVKLV